MYYKCHIFFCKQEGPTLNSSLSWLCLLAATRPEVCSTSPRRPSRLKAHVGWWTTSSQLAQLANPVATCIWHISPQFLLWSRTPHHWLCNDEDFANDRVKAKFPHRLPGTSIPPLWYTHRSFSALGPWWRTWPDHMFRQLRLLLCSRSSLSTTVWW